jgi:hypothetical protein
MAVRTRGDSPAGTSPSSLQRAQRAATGPARIFTSLSVAFSQRRKLVSSERALFGRPFR